MKTYPEIFEFSVSYTTRSPRNNEKHGIDYFFVEKETFLREAEKNKFLEYNKVHDNYYGTHRDVISSIVNSGKICLLDIDVQGVKMALANGLKVSYRMFLLPPDLDVLRARLEARGTDSKEVIQKRIENATREIELAYQLNIFNVFVKNENLEEFILDCEDVIQDWYPYIKNYKNI
jgi:guanylate kinase